MASPDGGEVDDAVTPIGAALMSLRAGIAVVKSGAARQVVINGVIGQALLPAARALARREGVVIEPAWWPDHRGCDIVIRRAAETA
jgi:hypothetical protein